MTTSSLADLETCLSDDIGPQARIEACTQAIDDGGLDDRDLVAVYRARGLAYDQRGEYLKAIADFDRTLRLDPTDVDARIARAEAYIAVGSFEGARRDYRRVLMLAPDHTDARQGCIDVLLALELEDQTEQALNHQCAIVTFDPLAYAEATHATGSTLLDVSEIESAIQGLVWEIEAWRSRRDYDKAAHAYSLARRLDADLLACRYTSYDAILLEAYDRSVRPEVYADAAIRPTFDELNAILADNPLDPVALRERGLLYMQVSAFEKAIEDFDQAILSDHHPEQIYALKGMVWLVGWGYDSAFHDLELALHGGADATPFHLARAQVLRRVGYHAEAVHILDMVIEALPDHSSDPAKIWMRSIAFNTRGSAKMHLGGTSELGIDDMATSFDLNGDYADAMDAQCGRD